MQAVQPVDDFRHTVVSIATPRTADWQLYRNRVPVSDMRLRGDMPPTTIAFCARVLRR